MAEAVKEEGASGVADRFSRPPGLHAPDWCSSALCGLFQAAGSDFIGELGRRSAGIDNHLNFVAVTDLAAARFDWISRIA
ncbi:hypothetical protein [Luteimonas sp. TWI1416]|uniref:hypothetical protein n=1 Tax=unclassified Luteimonas TaxID=2629088 RepID=UPI00320A6F16